MGIVDQVRDVAKLAQEYGKLELYQKAVELQSQVTDLAAENFELKQALTESRRTILDLEERMKLKGQVVYRHGVYYLNREDGSEDGPFCSRCWDAEHLLVHVDRNDHRFHCRNCDPDWKVKPPLPAPLDRKPLGW